MSVDNGESTEKAKAELFEANPDDFVNVKDLILAVKRGDGKIETLVAPVNRVELEIALMRITHQCYGVFNAMSHAEQQSKKSVIQKPGGEIMDFVRGGKK